MTMPELPLSLPSQDGKRSTVPFNFEGAEVRVITRDGEPWFVGNDICKVLGIFDPKQALGRLDDDERGRCTVPTPSGDQEMRIINESGLYSLILTSRKPAAKRFKKWVTSEVIPAIRKSGGYMAAAPDETPEELAARALSVLQATVERQKQQLLEVTPKAEALERIAESDGSFCITDAAKTLQVRPRDLFTYLRMNRWVFTRGGEDIAYQDKIVRGLLEHKTTTVYRGDGSERTYTQARVTPRGLTHLAKVLPPAARLVS